MVILAIQLTIITTVLLVNGLVETEILHTSSSSPVHSTASSNQPPLTGFIKSDTSLGSVGINVIRKINKPFECSEIEFINIPKNISSPLVGGPIFAVMDSELYNDRLAWTNGKDFLSYVETGDYGTWIVGNDPGVDSGFVYIKPKHISLTPIDLEHGDISWHWLTKKQWDSMDEVRLVCNDAIVKDSFYEVEYWDFGSQEPLRSHLTYDSQANIAQLYDKEHRQWIDLSNVILLCSLGKPVVVTDEAEGKSTIAILVNEEHSHVGWSLTFRRVPTNEADDAESMLWQRKDEVRSVLNSDGRLDGFAIRPLTNVERKASLEKVKTSFANVKRGDYVWMWYTTDGPAVNRTIGLRPLAPGLEDPAPSVVYSYVEEHTEVLLWCQSRIHNKAIFRYSESDRRDTMARGVLSRDTDYFIVNLDVFDGVGAQLDAASGGLLQDVSIVGSVMIGSDPVSFLRRYVEEKDGVLGGMSACYFYHAAVSIPAPFVYAGEIVCVLMGAKPVTMIQYESSSDEQWKFPLVQDLSTSIITAKHLLGDALDVDYRVHTYGDATTLIIFRKSRRYIVDNLLPRGLSQALHPMPYPDRANPEPDWRLQIYFAWWNGFLLGYPERFVDSYCTTFHNDLSEREKLAEARRAKEDMTHFLKSINRQPELIRLGLDPPVTDELWDLIQYQ